MTARFSQFITIRGSKMLAAARKEQKQQFTWLMIHQRKHMVLYIINQSTDLETSTQSWQS